VLFLSGTLRFQVPKRILAQKKYFCTDKKNSPLFFDFKRNALEHGINAWQILNMAGKKAYAIGWGPVVFTRSSTTGEERCHASKNL